MQKHGQTQEDLESREWFSIKTLSEHLDGVLVHTLYKWVEQGSFPSYYRLPNNQIRVHRDDLDAWVHSLRVAA